MGTGRGGDLISQVLQQGLPCVENRALVSNEMDREEPFAHPTLLSECRSSVPPKYFKYKGSLWLQLEVILELPGTKVGFS